MKHTQLLPDIIYQGPSVWLAQYSVLKDLARNARFKVLMQKTTIAPAEFQSSFHWLSPS